MSNHAAPNESEAERRFSAERDRIEYAPAQPAGPDRIDDDEAAEAAPEMPPPNIKVEGPRHMEH